MIDWAKVLAFLNDAGVKYVALFVIGFVMKKWPALVNKGIPTFLTGLSGAVAALAAWFPAVPTTAVPGSFIYMSFCGMQATAVASTGAVLSSWFFNTIIPVAFALATHTGPKNTIEWLQLGAKMFWTEGRPPAK